MPATSWAAATPGTRDTTAISTSPLVNEGTVSGLHALARGRLGSPARALRGDWRKELGRGPDRGAGRRGRRAKARRRRGGGGGPGLGPVLGGVEELGVRPGAGAHDSLRGHGARGARRWRGSGGNGGRGPSQRRCSECQPEPSPALSAGRRGRSPDKQRPACTRSSVDRKIVTSLALAMAANVAQRPDGGHI